MSSWLRLPWKASCEIDHARLLELANDTPARVLALTREGRTAAAVREYRRSRQASRTEARAVVQWWLEDGSANERAQPDAREPAQLDEARLRRVRTAVCSGHHVEACHDLREGTAISIVVAWAHVHEVIAAARSAGTYRARRVERVLPSRWGRWRLRRALRGLGSALARAQESSFADMAHIAARGDDESTLRFAMSLTIWGGAGSMSDQAGIDAPARSRVAIAIALRRLSRTLGRCCHADPDARMIAERNG